MHRNINFSKAIIESSEVVVLQQKPKLMYLSMIYCNLTIKRLWIECVCRFDSICNYQIKPPYMCLLSIKVWSYEVRTIKM